MPREVLPFEKQPHARNDAVLEVVTEQGESTNKPSNWSKDAAEAAGTGLEHSPEFGRLFLGLGLVDAGNELHALEETHVGPIRPGGIEAVVGAEQEVKDAFLIGVHLVDISCCDMVTTHVRAMRGGNAVVPQ